SRSLANEEISLEESWSQLNAIKQKKPPYNNIQITLAAVVAAPFFTIMFGGSLLDASGAVLATALAFPISLIVERYIGI
ncbi:threonine/serine exporter family protein, partial [Streptococcus suis]